MNMPATSTPLTRQSTGVAGLDEILGGGFIAHRSYLVRGGPGSGKSTSASPKESTSKASS